MPTSTYLSARTGHNFTVEQTAGGGLDVCVTPENDPMGYQRVIIEADPADMADIVVELLTWPAVVAAVKERTEGTESADLVGDLTPQLDAVAVGYFRRAFDHYGLVLAEAKALGMTADD